MLTRDGRLIFLTRTVRLFAYGMMSVVLPLHLSAAGLSDARIGFLLSLALAGDVLVSIVLSTRADRWGRRRTLFGAALLVGLAAATFASTTNMAILALAAIIGIMSPSGGEVGPFVAVEQAALSEQTRAATRTRLFAWYNLCGSVATALGALTAGTIAGRISIATPGTRTGYVTVLALCAVCAMILAAAFALLSPAVEARAASQARRPALLGVHRSTRTVLGLSGLFAMDAFGGGFIVQSLLALWFHARFGVEVAAIGQIFFWANILAGFSALAAASLARRIGLLNTMVFTHLPSNVLLMLIPLMPNVSMAVALLLLRFSISQMDVPTRQAYVIALVDPDERSAAQGITTVARSVGAATSPTIAGALLSVPAWVNWPLYLAGAIKIVYDLLLLAWFSKVPLAETAEETTPASSSRR